MADEIIYFANPFIHETIGVRPSQVAAVDSARNQAPNWDNGITDRRDCSAIILNNGAMLFVQGRPQAVIGRLNGALNG